MNNLFKKYQEDIVTTLKKEFNTKNSLALPRLEKIVINTGAAEALQTKDILEKIKDQLGSISGQTPKITLAKKSISSFKLKAQDPIGVMVTLRGQKAWDFLENFISIVIPRMRDFRGMSNLKFDKYGNYSVGLKEQALFPQIDLSKIDKSRGLVVTMVIKNSDKEKSKKLLELLGIPFQKEN